MNCTISRGNQLLNVAWKCSKTINMSNSLINCVFDLILPPSKVNVCPCERERRGEVRKSRRLHRVGTRTSVFSSTCRPSCFPPRWRRGAPAFVRRSAPWPESAAPAAVTTMTNAGRRTDVQRQLWRVTWVSAAHFHSQVDMCTDAISHIDNYINLQLFSHFNSFACLFIF